MYVKTECMIDLLYVFTTRQWKFDNSNTRELWSLLSQDDRNTFWYSLEEFDWASYIKVYFYGIRKHVLHEELSNVDTATVKNQKYNIFLRCNFSSIITYSYFIYCFQIILVASVMYFCYYLRYFSSMLDVFIVFILTDKTC